MGRESLGLLGGDGGSTVDQLGHDTSNSLNSLRKRGNIQQQNLGSSISSFSRKNSSLYSSSESNSLIGVNSLGRFLSSKEFRDKALYLGDTGRSSYKNDLINLTLLNVSIGHDTSNGSKSLLEQIIVQLLESCTGKGLGKIKSFCKILNFKTSLLLSRKCTLDTLNLLTKLLKSTLISRDILVALLLHHLDEELHDTLIEILSSQMGISVGSKYLEYSIINGKKGNIECSTSKIEYKNIGFSSGLVHTVSNCSSGRLVDNTLNLHSRNSSSILGSLTLSIVEVSRNGNNSVMDILSEESLGGLLHLLQDHGGNLLGSEILLFSSNSNLNNRLVIVRNNFVWNKLLIRLNRFVRVITSNETLYVKDGIFGVDGSLVLCSISNKTVSVVHESNVRRSNTVTLVIGDNFYASILEYSNTGIGGSEIDSNYGSHLYLFLSEG
mmetsp:Transcript_27977/g.41494  ORF Transcript_27977/g.41494 Transcript_27977/m.41494 type:complete len:438 (-) Transcript_27977:128-1441(-)